MKPKHLRSLLAAISLMTLAPATAPAMAQDPWPARPVSIVVPYSPGGSTDSLARILGQKISASLGQPVVIENRAGAASNIGVGFVARAAADGYTIGLVTSTAMSVNPGLYKSLPFDPDASFEPIILATILPSAVFVNSTLPVNNLDELNDYLKRHPSKAQYASSGAGSAPHLGAELYRAGVGLDAIHVPYKGGAPALVGLVSADTTFMIAVTPEGMPLVDSGKLKALAVTTLHRLPDHPDLPTVAETAIPGYELIWAFGFVAPKGTPKTVVDRLHAAFSGALQDPDVVKRLKTMGYDVAGGEPRRLTETMHRDRLKWKKVIDDLKLRAD